MAALEPTDTPFRSFWMGGFEGADHVNLHGRPLHMGHATGHDDALEADYRLAASLNLRTVRESMGWRLCEPSPRQFDFDRVRCMQAAANRHGIQVLWSLMHYGTPSDLSVFDDAMIDRFAAFVAEAARVLAPLHDEAPIYTPVNEISYLAWAASNGSMGMGLNAVKPAQASSEISGWHIKQRLVRATLAAMDAIRHIDPRARFLHVEPVVHVTHPVERPDLAPLADKIRGYQWQAWDLLAGRDCPELGGHPGALDLLGVNHYHSSQWEVGTEQRLSWHLKDPRRLPLDALLAEVWQRYRRPLVVAETSHVGQGRAEWLNDIASHVERALARNLPVHGLCLYPLLDRPDWDDEAHWHHSGLVEVVHPDHAPHDGTPPYPRSGRLLCEPYAQALARWQQRLPRALQSLPAAA